MTSSMLEKASCVICGKVNGSFTCRGCEKHFCTQHVAEHRQELSKQMDQLTVDHDQLQQNLSEQTLESRQCSVMKQINEWEQKSIEKIRRIADDARKQLENTIEEYDSKLTKDLTKISDEIRIARENDNFFEPDFDEWMMKLEKLKKDIIQPLNIKLEQDNNGIISLITKPVEVMTPKESFGRCMGNILIEDIGHVIVKKQDLDDASVRGTCEYTSGQHRLRFKIEECGTSKWIFIGIISKHVPMEAMSYKSRSSYGWAAGDSVYLNGCKQSGFNGYKCDIGKNDILELFIDCDQQMIRLKNERTRRAYEINVDTNKCQFPWQINFHLYWRNDRVRILQI